MVSFFLRFCFSARFLAVFLCLRTPPLFCAPPPPSPRPLRRRPRGHHPLRRRREHRQAREGEETRERGSHSRRRSSRWGRGRSSSCSLLDRLPLCRCRCLLFVGPFPPPPVLDPARRDRARGRPGGQVGRQGPPVAEEGQRLYPADARKPSESERSQSRSGKRVLGDFYYLTYAASHIRLLLPLPKKRCVSS